MMSGIKWRAALAVAACLVALFFLTPTLVDDLPTFWNDHLPKDKIHLGLDLQGGMHLVLEVDAAKAVDGTLQRTAGDLKETLMAKRVRFRQAEAAKAGLVTYELPDGASRTAFEKVLKDNYPDIEVAVSETREGREVVSLKINDKRAGEIRKLAVEQSLETIRNRVDQFGISEPEIIPQGDDRIIIQLPGVKDTQRAKNLIGRTALLEFKLVDEEHSVDEALRGSVPDGSMVLNESRLDRESGRRIDTPLLLKSATLLTGESLENAKVQISDRFGEPHVSIKFNAQGAKEFERITGANVKRRLAIVLDGVVHSAPVIQERIAGGNAQITGSFTMDEARDLAIVLRAGALPAPVKILEERTVGPSLGQDSIDKGTWACIIASILILLFMIVYYRLTGMIADVALVMNLLLLLGVMAAFKATLTLPGIAGIVLTIGMAVDANVLINERIREEMRLGKTLRAAVEAGYAKAFLTILDSNITTLVAALFLFGFGTGPVKGFAVTLTIGIIVSLFTAVFVTRIIFDYFIWNRKVQTISI
ncbi:MAG TPA: protein translocase subunit SecD [Syntrophus sp. (in: bacteria)]|jgi:preprotein translocase subunit SecD|nr:protein translocase subunit SecD [Syntrophus sp. (in: bacteria)]